MRRTLLYPFAGAGIGFLAAVAIVHVMAGPSPPSDTNAVAMLAGIFLAGCGAIAGAIVGGVEFFKRRPSTRDDRQQRESS